MEEDAPATHRGQHGKSVQLKAARAASFKGGDASPEQSLTPVDAHDCFHAPVAMQQAAGI